MVDSKHIKEIEFDTFSVFIDDFSLIDYLDVRERVIALDSLKGSDKAKEILSLITSYDNIYAEDSSTKDILKLNNINELSLLFANKKPKIYDIFDGIILVLNELENFSKKK